MKRTATLVVLLLFCGLPNAWAQLAGTYTIGGTSPDYATFAAAAADLDANGVSGAVVFNVRTGTYTEQLTLGAVTGTSATNTITFQSESGTASDVTLQFTPTSSSDNWTVQLTDTDHVIIQNMTLLSGGSATSNRRVVELEGTLDGLSFLGNTLEGRAVAFAASGAELIYADFNSRTTGLTISGNTFVNGGYGVYLLGSTSNRSTGTVIANNAFTGTTGINIDLTAHDGASMTGNTLAASSRVIELNTMDVATLQQNTFTGASTSTTGLFMSSVTGAYRIERNRFQNVSGTAMQISNSSATSGSEALIANNVVTLGDGFSGTGIYLTGSTDHVQVLHNTLVSAAQSTGAYLMRAESSGSSVVLRNNIFAHYGTGVPLSIGGTLPSVSDFNAVFAAGSVVARVNNVNYSFFSDYQAATSLDLQSQNVDPAFTDRDGADNTAGTDDDNLIP
ncbi:MAG: right-handed parallel beta-helix repeat-containing protein, partial [Bacteroidota bacterium]